MIAEIRASEGGIVCERCVIADTVGLRLRGLLGRRALAPGEGLWIRPANSVHMFFMRFAIDAVFVDGAGVVVRVVSNLRPWRLSTCGGARSVLELALGEAERRGLRPGVRLENFGHPARHGLRS